MVRTGTLRRPLAAATGLLVVGVAVVALRVDVRAAAYLLAAGLGAAAVIRAVLPEYQVLTGRGRRFDVAVLLILAAVVALLAPWGLAMSPG